MEAAAGFANNLGAFDALLLVLFLVSCGFGMAQGFTAIVFTKLSILAGVWFAFFNGKVVAEMLVSSGVQQPAAGFAAPALIIFLAGLIGWLIASSVVKMLKLLKLGFLNSLLGGCYGFLRIAALVLAGTAAAAHLDTLDKSFYDSSRIMHASGWTLYQIKEAPAAPAPIRDFLGSFSYDEENYRPTLAAAAAEKTGRTSRRRRNGQQQQATVPEDEAEVAKMLERIATLKKTSDAVAGRRQQAEPEQESWQKRRERQEKRQRLRQLENTPAEERLAEELAELREIDGKLLEELIREDETLGEYLERFEQQIPGPEELQPEN